MAKQNKKIILIIFVITVALALTIALLVKNSNRIIKNELEKALGKKKQPLLEKLLKLLFSSVLPY